MKRTNDFRIIRSEGGLLPSDLLRRVLAANAEAVESLGRGRGVRHHLSRVLYASLGKSGAYTRRRGLDHETNKAFLLAHLRGNQETGAPLSELCQVYPAQSTSSVQRVMRELRSEGRVILRGSRKGARRILVAGKGQDAPVQ